MNRFIGGLKFQQIKEATFTGHRTFFPIANY